MTGNQSSGEKFPMTDFMGFPDCMLCRDTGLVYYEIPQVPYLVQPSITSQAPYRWCACKAGVNRRAEDPGLVDRSNSNFHKLGLK